MRFDYAMIGVGIMSVLWVLVKGRIWHQGGAPVIPAKYKQTPDEIELQSLSRYWQTKYHALEASIKCLGYEVVVIGDNINLIKLSGTTTSTNSNIIGS